MPETLDPKEAEFRRLLQRIQVAGSFESADIAERLTELGEELIERKRIRRASAEAAEVEAAPAR